MDQELKKFLINDIENGKILKNRFGIFLYKNKRITY